MELPAVPTAAVVPQASHLCPLVPDAPDIATFAFG
jgi:hypothetical protein